MSKIRLFGTSSGYVEIAPAAAASNNTLTAPSTVGEIIAKDAAGAIGITSMKASNVNVGAAVTITESGIEASGIGITCANINGTQIGGRRNLVINGAMTIAQRGTSSTTAGMYTVDRFTYAWNGHDEALTQAQVDVSSGTTPYTEGFRKAYKVTNGNQTSGAGASDILYFEYHMEAQDIANSGWNYTSSTSFITLSFWVKSSVSQDFKGYVRTPDGSSHTYAYSTGTLSANTWTKIVKTIPGNSNLTIDNDTGQGFQIYLWPYIGTTYTDAGVTEDAWTSYSSSARTPVSDTSWWTTNDATFEVTGFQLEVGSQATPFEHRQHGEEVRLCQRYYQKYIGPRLRGVIGSGSASINRMGMTLLVEMRANPTATFSGNQSLYDGGGTATMTAIAAPYVDTVSFECDATISGNLNNGSGSCVTAYLDGSEGTLELNAEL